MFSRYLTLTMIAFFAVSIPACKGKKSGDAAQSAAGDKGAAKPAADAVNVELYVMSQCPYGVKALDAMLPAIDQLGTAVNLKLDYIGRKGDDGKLQSMHGEAEVKGDILQLCAGEVAPAAQTKFILCLNKNWRSIPKDWEACAQEASVDQAAMKACIDGDQGQQLLAASFERAQKAGAQGSPTIKVAGEPYRGGRRTEDFLRGICNEIAADKKPEACKNIPEPPKVQVIAISDKRCKECDTSKVIQSLKQVFPGLDAKTLDWSEEEAQKIAKEAEIKLLPAVLFDDSISKDEEGSKNMARWLVPAGKYKSLRIGGEFDPTAEICDNQKDDTGNGKADCEDDTCKESLVCREKKPNRLDVFVMSQCPYGVLGLNAMKDVFEAFGDEMEFGIHYIASKQGDEFRSLHGQPEVEENIRELCAIEHYAKDKKYMDYIWCRNKDIRSQNWQECAKSSGIDAKVIEKCSTGDQGKKLLEEDIKLAEALKIGGSPTWLINNQVTFNAVAAKDIQENFCKHNADLKGCKVEIKGGDAPAAPQGSCGG